MRHVRDHGVTGPYGTGTKAFGHQMRFDLGGLSAGDEEGAPALHHPELLWFLRGDGGALGCRARRRSGTRAAPNGDRPGLRSAVALLAEADGGHID
jgi:hypothetical protein